jgi:hypothetical protein
MSETQSLIFHPRHEPPDNELPGGLDLSGVRWLADGIAVAVPSGLAYADGVVLTIMCRTRRPRGTDIREAAKAVRLGLSGQENEQGIRFTCDGRPVVLLGGQHRDNGFTYTAWVGFTRKPPGDLVMTLQWPGVGISKSDQRVAGEKLAQAAAEAVVLWPRADVQT